MICGGPDITIPTHLYSGARSQIKKTTVHTQPKRFCSSVPTASVLQINTCIVALWDTAFSGMALTIFTAQPGIVSRRESKQWTLLPKAFREWSVFTMKTLASRLPAPITKYKRVFQFLALCWKSGSCVQSGRCTFIRHLFGAKEIAEQISKLIFRRIQTENFLFILKNATCAGS